MSSETKLVCSTCISCPKEEILRRLQRETTCSACCSALRLMTERPLAELVLLDSFVDREDETGYVLNEDLASPAALEAACAKFPLQEWLKNCQPLKRDKRCPMHTNSRHIFNQADLWEDMWAELSAAQKATICAVGAGELHDKLWQHCTDKHHLCKDCRSNVMWAYDRLTKKELPPVGTEAEQEAELSSLQAYFDIERSTEGTICVHSSALPTILYHYEDTLAEEAESSSKGRHAPTRQAGLSELLCVVGRLLLRKVLTSYQTSLEEEQNQQLLVRLVLSHFQAQTLERHAAQCAESLLEGIENDAGKASKRKLKKERQKHRREAEAEEQAVTWDEQQELALLSRMGWSNAAAVALGGGGESAPGGGGAADATGGGAHPPPANGCGVAGGGGGDGRATEREAAAPGRGGAELDAARALALHPVDAASLELTESEQREFSALARQKGQLMEERDRMRAAIRERFERFALGGSKGVA